MTMTLTLTLTLTYALALTLLQTLGYSPELLMFLLKTPRKLDAESPVEWINDVQWGMFGSLITQRSANFKLHPLALTSATSSPQYQVSCAFAQNRLESHACPD